MISIALAALATLTTSDVCPSRIQTNQSAKAAEKGWHAIQAPRVHELNGLMLYYDHPSTLRELPPDSVEKTASGERFNYVVPKDARQIWVECEYVATSVVLRKQLPRSLKQCVVVRARSRKVVESISCK